MSNLTATQQQAWQALSQHYEAFHKIKLSELFAQDSQRFAQYSFESAGWLLDYSKNHVSAETIKALVNLAEACELPAAIKAMTNGVAINNTEQRAVGHMALRIPRAQKGSEAQRFIVNGEDQMPLVHAVLDQCSRFANAVRSGQWLGYSGQAITDVVNIGIGGSDLGPQMATIALREYWQKGLQLHFVSNVDGHDISETLERLNPATTLFVIASKTFTTQETMANAHAARRWFLAEVGLQNTGLQNTGLENLTQSSPQNLAIGKHFVAVSTNAQAVQAFGIDAANMFGFWDWVGGRYSMWSAIGMPMMLAIGPERFAQFLSGAHAMDEHFKAAPLQSNMPVLIALLEVWYRNFYKTNSRCIAPYHHRLRRLPAYLQQLDMESLGKSVDREGHPLTRASGTVIWGEPGTNGQHAYFQLLHQGTDVIPVDFILVAQADHSIPDQQRMLLANGLAQSRALMVGRDLADSGSSHKTFSGNRPSNTLVTQHLTPESLGALIAMYEHKVFVCSVIWNINAFDQWGVELGKVLAKGTEQLLMPDGQRSETTMASTDSSTLGLANYLRAHAL
jgi:glucose-6-phosphate isomerase